LLINIGIYLKSEELHRESRLLDLIRIFVRTRIRCYVCITEATDCFDQFDPQYCVVREILKEGVISDTGERELIFREIEHCDKKRIGLIITDLPTILREEQEFKLPVIDLNRLLKRRESISIIAGEIIEKFSGHYPSPDRYVVIDVGTNNVLLVWALIIKGEIRVFHRASRISAMGKNMRGKRVTKAGIERVKRILRDFLLLSKYFSQNITILGTSCSRESDNISLLSDWLKERYDIEYRILSDEEEASLLGKANRNLFREFRELIIFDIGGGSTEFIYYVGERVTYQKSLRLGIRRLENLSREIRGEQKDYIDKRLSMLPARLLDNPVLVGIGGTVTNISAVKKGLTFYDSAEVHKSILTRKDIDYYLQTFSRMNLQEIAELMPFEPLRANIIVSGLLVVSSIMDYFGRDYIYVSDFGIQFGILEQIASTKKRGRTL